MKGKNVIVRAFGDEPLVRRVWEVGPKRVYICDDEGFERIKRVGVQPDCFPIAFPREHVFQYDQKLFELVSKQHKTNPSVWRKLTVWSGDTNVYGAGKSR